MTMKQLRKEICASLEHAADFHAQNEDRRDGDQVVSREKRRSSISKQIMQVTCIGPNNAVTCRGSTTWMRCGKPKSACSNTRIGSWLSVDGKND